MNEKNDNVDDDKNIMGQSINNIEKSIKVVLIGETSVGKTSLISLFTKGEVDPDINTINEATFIKKKVDYKEENKIISFEIQDTAGKEKYPCLSIILFQNTTVALIVYDLSNKKHLKKLKITGWIL